MTAPHDAGDMRQTLLAVVDEMSQQESFQMRTVLAAVCRRLGIRGTESEQALLTLWYDLFRQGHLAWGYNLSNPDPPFVHLTDQGRRTLEHLGRDPANPDGYMAYLRANTTLNAVAESYMFEALTTYNANCIKATAVMVGAAAESLVLEVRDRLVESLGGDVPQNLQDWRVRRVLTALQEILEEHAGTMPHRLREAFAAYWPGLTQQIRTVRNDAGHPTALESVSQETVHGSLLLFPELARIAADLCDWITNNLQTNANSS